MPTEPKIAHYGWRRDHLDPRDRIYNLEESIQQGAALRPEIDLSGEMPPIYDQAQLGSCTANATAALLQHMQMKQGEAEGDNVPSRLFIYYEERRIEGQPLDQDSGAEVRDGIKVLVTEGAPPESEWPYSDANPGPFQERPPDSAFADALKYEAVLYKRILPTDVGAPMRTALASHYPIAFGFSVPAMFESQSWNPATDYLPLPDLSTQYIGGHAVVVVGYDFSLSRFPVPVFKVRNSWSEGWGDQGHFYMDYRWFDPGRQLADDLWVVMSVR
jgi:C1A family cysteine protease